MRRTFLLPALAGLGCAAIAAGFCRCYFGSLENTLAFVNGDRIVVENGGTYAVEAAAAERPIDHFFWLRNLGSKDYAIIGTEIECRCTVVDKLPVKIKAGESQEFAMTLIPPEGSVGKDYSATIMLYTDIPHSPIPLTIAISRVTN